MARSKVTRVSMEGLGSAYRDFADDWPYFGVNLQIGEAAAYLEKAVEITPVGEGTLRASWDPAIERTRSVSGRPGEFPTAAQVRSKLRRLRPGQDALISNAATASGQRKAYAELVWVRGISDQLPSGGQAKVEAHLDQEFPRIFRRAEQEFADGS